MKANMEDLSHDTYVTKWDQTAYKRKPSKYERINSTAYILFIIGHSNRKQFLKRRLL